jgi:hypothetical protein
MSLSHIIDYATLSFQNSCPAFGTRQNDKLKSFFFSFFDTNEGWNITQLASLCAKKFKNKIKLHNSFTTVTFTSRQAIIQLLFYFCKSRINYATLQFW